MKTIYKYKLLIKDKQVINMPKGAKILCINNVEGIPYLWAELNSEEKSSEPRILFTFGTGHEVLAGLDYIGTYFIDKGKYVFHVYEGIK